VDVCIDDRIRFGFIDCFYVGVNPRNMEGPVTEQSNSAALAGGKDVNSG
jgi:hypothetical protein